MLQHLRKCPNILATVHDAAQAECVERRLLTNSPIAQRVAPQNAYSLNDPLPAPNFGLALQSHRATGSSTSHVYVSSMCTSVVAPIYYYADLCMPSAPASSELLLLGAGLQSSTSPNPIMPAASYPNEYQHSPVVSTYGSSPSPSLYIPPSCQSSSSNLSSMLPLGLGSPALPQPWTDADRAHFGAWLAWITASCGFPFSWVEDPEWLGFLQEFLPTAEPIKCQSLANHWIPLEVGKFCQEAKNHSRGLEGTIQCDGWSGINFYHFIAFMLTTSKCEVACFE